MAIDAVSPHDLTEYLLDLGVQPREASPIWVKLPEQHFRQAVSFAEN